MIELNRLYGEAKERSYSSKSGRLRAEKVAEYIDYEIRRRVWAESLDKSMKSIGIEIVTTASK